MWLLAASTSRCSCLLARVPYTTGHPRYPRDPFGPATSVKKETESSACSRPLTIASLTTKQHLGGQETKGTQENYNKKEEEKNTPPPFPRDWPSERCYPGSKRMPSGSLRSGNGDYRGRYGAARFLALHCLCLCLTTLQHPPGPSSASGV